MSQEQVKTEHEPARISLDRARPKPEKSSLVDGPRCIQARGRVQAGSSAPIRQDTRVQKNGQQTLS